MKRIKYFVILALLVLTLAACGNNEGKTSVGQNDKKTTDDTNENSMVSIYYPGENRVVAMEDKYQIKQPDSISASVEEIMLCLMEHLDDRMEYNTYLIDGDNNLSLQFVCNGEYSREYMLLAKAAICETLFQIKDINSISISIADINGENIEGNFYLRNSFYFYDYGDDELTNEK